MAHEPLVDTRWAKIMAVAVKRARGRDGEADQVGYLVYQQAALLIRFEGGNQNPCVRGLIHCLSILIVGIAWTNLFPRTVSIVVANLRVPAARAERWWRQGRIERASRQRADWRNFIGISAGRLHASLVASTGTPCDCGSYPIGKKHKAYDKEADGFCYLKSHLFDKTRSIRSSSHRSRRWAIVACTRPEENQMTQRPKYRSYRGSA